MYSGLSTLPTILNSRVAKVESMSLEQSLTIIVFPTFFSALLIQSVEITHSSFASGNLPSLRSTVLTEASFVKV